ncbi:MAG: hypothetical protein QNI90_10965 [Dinoroseobacter sp.]|nr:hypothetical protein [Dinoroseobacter sp.]
MTGKTDQSSVRRRYVFYLPGYDPFPTRRYREMYRREGARQAKISDYTLHVKGQAGAPVWEVSAEIEGFSSSAHVEVLEWADLVRASMRGGVVAVYAALFRTAWVYVSTGVLFRLFGLRKGPVLAALYPVLALLVQLGIAMLIGVLVWRGVGAFFGLLVGVGSVWMTLVFFRRLDRFFLTDYLMQDYAYASCLKGAYPPELEARLDAFADRVAAVDGDEVLIVGHSSGAYLAVSVMARLAQSGRLTPRMALLTLGQVIPMISLLPEAARLRDDLKLMGAQDQVFWLDVTAPGDGCAFALCHPVGVSGVAGPDTHWPRVISARFSETLKPETWRALRWRFFRLHFQYMHAFDQPGDYDYFQITAGGRSLADRYAKRAPSPSVKGAP